ncbi:uncharacterized protein [Antedon mediterranea]|uniref:uncharacterized protein n=1 Tax=Antedon mediterranea TaxID=105859 RepID=UPI003AF9CFF9
MSFHSLLALNAEVIYEGEDCKRECTGEKVTCKFTFQVEWFTSMSKECGDCPTNINDCKQKDCIPLDGGARAVMVVNRQIPGPSIQACENDTIEVTVVNRLDNSEGLSIHWHGLHAKGTPYMDGISMLTQCPIPSQASFLYSFEAYPAGTHWWHSHSGMQRADGLFGSLIVRKPESDEFYRYDHEHVLLVNDWFHDLTIAKFAGNQYGKGSNKADTILINGKGIITNPENGLDSTTREIFTVEYGKIYRFRTISGAITDCGLKVSVDDHKIYMIASDGAAIDAQETDSFITYAGERFDFLLNATKDRKNYWLRVQGVESGCRGKSQLAIIQYAGQDESSANQLPNTHQTMDGTTVNTLENNIEKKDISIRNLTSREDDDMAFSEEADETYYIGMDFGKIMGTPPQLDSISFSLPPSPPLSQYEDIPEGTFCDEETFSKNCSTQLCRCTRTIGVGLDNVVEFVVVNEGQQFNTSHPMHLHGHFFRVIGFEKIGEETSVEQIKEMDRQGLLPREAHLSLKKDTVIVPDGGYVILRFHANNPGWWFFHCHLEFHVELGMALIVRVGEQSDLPPVPNDFYKCGNFLNIPGSVNCGHFVSSFNISFVIMMSLILFFI